MTSINPGCRIAIALTLLASAEFAASQPALDYDFFRDEIQPVFLAKREGLMRCADCHTGEAYSAFNLVPLSEGSFFWNEDQSRQNFKVASAFVVPGEPLESRLLRHPLAIGAGGDPFHGGGKHFWKQDDPEWQLLRDWVMGATRRDPIEKTAVRVVQTNSAGDRSHIIDPDTNEVVGVVKDIELPHGVAGSPDGARLYFTNETLHTLDVVDSRTLKVYRRIPLSGGPNNLSVTPDGRKIYVGIMEMPGAVDVIDARTLENVETIPVDGAIHNVYVTPDGRYAVGGSIHTSTINVIDTATDELAWKLTLSSGIRPMTFDTYPDGSTRNIYVQLSFFHGFAVVDFNERQEIARIEHPPVPGVHAHEDGLQMAPTHGLGINRNRLWSTSKVYGYAYVHALPELNEVGRVFVGQHPEWITFTPDGRFAYVGAAGDNATFVIDTESLEEVARIPVGQVPKRNATVLMAVE